MACIVTFDKNGNKNGVTENNDLFQEILSNPHVKNFDEAIDIFQQTYSDKVGIPVSVSEVGSTAKALGVKSKLTSEQNQKSLDQTSADLKPNEILPDILKKLNQTGLASKVVLLNNSEINEKLKEFGVDNVTQTTTGFVHNSTKTVYLNTDNSNIVNTAMHEHGHLYLDYLKENKSELYQAGLAKTQTVEAEPYIAYVKKTQPNLIEGTEAFQNEVLAQVIGDMGAKLVNSKQQDGLAQWLSDLWTEIKNMLGLSKYTNKQVQNMTLQQYADAINVDLLSGKKINDLFNPLLQELARINPAFEGIQLTETPQEPTPQTRVVTPFGIERNRRRNIFKKEFGETAADAILSKLSGAMQNEPEQLIAFLKEFVPIKATMADVINANGAYLQKMFEKSIGETEDVKKKSTLRPEDLLNKANYSFDVKTDLEDAQKTYKGYYKDGEVICTLYSKSNRFNESYVTFFVRDDARETPHANDLTQENITERWAIYLESQGRKNADGTFNLKNLRLDRLDPYSTSVMSVQISKRGKTLKSVSRYNHKLTDNPDGSVVDPDQTYKNLDNIVDELHDSFYKFFNVVQPTGSKSDVGDGYILNGEGQLFKTNGERYGVNFGEGFYIKSNGETVILDPVTQMMGDSFLFDTKNGTVIDVADYSTFTIGKNQGYNKIQFTSKNTIKLTGEFTTEIEIKDGNLYKLKSNATTIGNAFLYNNKTLTELSLPNNTTIGDYFLRYNETLTELSLPNNTTIGDYFLNSNTSLTELSLPKNTKIGNYFLYNNETLTELSLPNNTTIGNSFLRSNKALTELSLPKNTKIGDYFLRYNETLTELSLPNNTTIGDSFLNYNETLTELSLPNNTTIGDYFLNSNKTLTELSLPNNTTIGDYFLNSNKTLTKEVVRSSGKKLTESEFKVLYEKAIKHGKEINERILNNINAKNISGIRYSISKKENQLKYQNEKGQIFSNYSEALRNTTEGEVKAGVNTVEGFKELFSVDTNTSLNTFGGTVNYLTKAKILNGESYLDVDNNVYLTVEGKNQAKVAINADSAKSVLQKALGRRAVTLMVNGTIKINADRTEQQIQIGDKFVKASDLTKDFKTLTKEHGKDMAVSIITAQALKEENNKNKSQVKEQEFTPENELQEKLMNLLKKMGIKTLDLATYIKNYTTKNGVHPDANALADLINQVVAFKDGIITTEDLAEETSHFIVAMTPVADKENLLRNIHKTKEWMQYSEQYREIYNGNEELVREEILGKVLANALQSKFSSETQENATAKSIVQKLGDIVNNFFNKIASYFQDSFQNELDTYTQQVYNNLMNDTLSNQLGENNSSATVMYSTANASPTATTLYLKAKKLLERLKAQQAELSKQYRNNSDKDFLTRTEQTLAQEEDKISQLEKIKAVSNLIMVVSSQSSTLIKTVENKKDTGYRFSSQEHNVFTHLVKYNRQSLLEITSELDSKVKEESVLISEIEKTLKEIDNLLKITSKNNDISFKAISQKVMDKADMSDKDREVYQNIIEASLRAGQEDTTFMHAHLGSLLAAKNPLLNLAGDVIERTNLEHISNFQEHWKRLMNELDSLGFTSHTQLSKLVKDGYIINERDNVKVVEKDSKEKTEILNGIILNLAEVHTYEAVTEKTLGETLKKIAQDHTANGIAVRTAFNKLWSKSNKERREPYFLKTFNDALQAHEFTINGKVFSLTVLAINFEGAVAVDKQYSSERTQIYNNSEDNALTKEDKYRLQEIDKRRSQDANPRSLDGRFKLGVTEVFNENLGKYVVVLEEDYKNLPLTQQEQAKTIVGLNIISLVKQDFYSKDENKRPDGIPQKFIDDLTALQTEEERKEFLYENAYVSFPDEYWNQLNNNTGIVENLRNQGTVEADELIDRIRKEQSIVTSILKENRVYNRPSETNFMEMNEIHQLSIKDAQTELDNLYTQARLLLRDLETENTTVSESLVNDSYANELENRQITTLNGELDFIEEHVTRNKKVNIVKARDLVDKLKKGVSANISKSLQGYLNENMSEIELGEGLLEYAKSNLLPYFKKTEPIGFSDAMNSMGVLDFIQQKDLVKVTPAFSFYENLKQKNPKWEANNKAKKEQLTKEYLDTVKNKEYYSYFDLDEQGNRKSNKNDKEWQARTAILNYQDQMIEYNSLTGVQNRYMLPQVRRLNAERFASTTINGLKESFKDIVTYRPEEQERGADFESQTGTSLLTIPTYYNRPIDDSKELTDNILYAYAMYGNQASLHKSRKENIGDMLVLEDILLGVDFTNKEADATNAYKMLQGQLKANFYGVQETFSYEGTLMGVKVDFGKLAKSFNSYSKFSNITGLVVPLTSALQSSIQKRVEMMVGEVTNNSAAKVANRIFLAHASESAKEAMGLNSKAFINVVGEALGNYSIVERLKHSKYTKVVRTVLKANNSTHQLGNFPVTSRAFLSVLSDYRYVNGIIMTQDKYKKLPENIGKTNSEIVRNWEKYEVFIDDVIYATKEGVLDFKNPEFLKRVSAKTTLQGDELIKSLLLKKEQMSQKALGLIQRIDSQIPEHQRSIAARNSMSNFFLSHLNYLLVQIPLKVKSKHYNISEESWQEGNWSTAYSFIGKMIKNSTNPAKFKQAWKESMGDELIRKNLKRTAIELAVGNALALMAMALAKYVDDDDDPAYVVTLADYIFTRAATEQIGSTLGLPKQIGNVIENPLMVYSKAKDLFNVSDLWSGEDVESGVYAGESKSGRFLTRNLPLLKDYERFKDPKKAADIYLYFNENKADLFDNYAWLSNAFDEE